MEILFSILLEILSVFFLKTGALLLIFYLILFYSIFELNDSCKDPNVKIILLVLWILNYIVLFYILYKIIYYCEIFFLPLLISNFICSISALSEITEHNEEFDIFNVVSTIITMAMAIIVMISFYYFTS